ncbi:type 1 fimbria pilin [Pantoea sp. PA1]|jgi:type 1 fimbria pilin|uniref:Fimbrial protein n=1 Tax=Pantoea ananas TaxID=553 RepID=A0A8A4K099_PANAN|nr:fimbrial protein [Pantoea ananatis]KNA29439.1 fimbria A protein [Pantoea ananatis]MBN6028870.1 fimbrial protein [Pantoea ananatis]MDH0053371.1 fimbrial protein [Pantoea ananatis]MDJ0032078.1 fimbrial protein [Pantoea ananatis]MDJ0043307.1 fimbrial protein [Pantoea ananatis]
MKLNKLASVLALGLSMAAISNVYAVDDVANQGQGKITFTGSIIDAACSISPETSDQEVSLGQIAASQLADNGTSKPVNFEIDLQHCTMNSTTSEDENGKPTVTTTAPSVKVTFGGSPAIEGDNTWFGITGTASGAGVVITDASSNKIPVGGTTEMARELIEGDNTLGFSAYLQGLGDKVTTGEFSSIADFTLAYE